MVISLIVLASALVLAYTTAVCVKRHKIPVSISSSFYAIKHRWWFRATMWGTPMLLMPAALEVSSLASGWMFFLAAVGMIAVGCAPDYQNDPDQKKVHEFGAIMAIGFSQSWVYCNSSLWLYLWVVYAVYTLLYMLKSGMKTIRLRFMRSKPMFWIEVVSIVTMIGSVLSSFCDI